MAKGRFTKGNPGRPTGAVNKTTAVTREAVAMIVSGQWENLEAWIEQVAATSPKDAFYMVTELMQYGIPKMKAVEMSGKDGEALTVRFIDANPNR